MEVIMIIGSKVMNMNFSVELELMW